MSDELDALRRALETGDYSQALAMVDELDEMNRSDKRHKIRSYMRILLIHMIKREAHQQLTPSWRRSIAYALDEIADSNARESGSTYFDEDALAAQLRHVWRRALAAAADEAFDGRYTPSQLATMVDKEALLEDALRRMLDRQAEEGTR